MLEERLVGFSFHLIICKLSFFVNGRKCTFNKMNKNIIKYVAEEKLSVSAARDFFLHPLVKVLVHFPLPPKYRKFWS